MMHTSFLVVGNMANCTHQARWRRTTKRLKGFAQIAVVSLLTVLAAAPSAAPAMNLDRFYIHHLDPTFIGGVIAGYPTQFIPEVRVVGGGAEPPPTRIRGGDGKEFRSVHRLVGIFAFRYDYPPASAPAVLPAPWGDSATPLGIWAAWSDYMGVASHFPINRPVLADTALPKPDAVFPVHENWLRGRNNYPSDIVVGTYGDQGTPPAGRTVQSEYTVRSPIRRTAIDGSQYDASPMEVKRGGAPWYTHFWGYRLGLVANESTFNAATGRALVPEWNPDGYPSPASNFELAFLPPPVVEDDVVEYVNKPDFPKQPGGQFFYAVRAEDKTLLDSIPAWQRTGKAFKSGGYVSACRFYGGKNGGPNTHFYSADDKECAALKAIPTLSYEGQTFAVNMPLPGSNADGSRPCPLASKPLFRLYNNASAPGKDYISNHRYVTARADVTAAVAQGWVDEGQVMCVPL